MEYTINNQSNETTVTLYGDLRPSARATFLEALEKLDKSGSSKWIIDLGDVYYLDSHGMGLMVELQDKAKTNSANVVVRGANDLVKRMFDLSRFDLLFEIET